MATRTAFYVKTDHKHLVVEQLKKLTGLDSTNDGKFPSDFSNHYILRENATPNYLAVGAAIQGWVIITHNSFNRLAAWSKIISADLNTKVIVTMAQSVSGVYYFSLYDKGQQFREIEVCYSEDSKVRNVGHRFDFENEQPGSKVDDDGGIDHYFGFDEIESYCKQFGLIIQTDYNDISWSVLRSGTDQKIINDLFMVKERWWKFW